MMPGREEYHMTKYQGYWLLGGVFGVLARLQRDAGSDLAGSINGVTAMVFVLVGTGMLLGALVQKR